LEEHPVDDTTNRLVDAYYATWGSGDLETFRELLTEDFKFRGALDSADSPGAFIDIIRRNAPMFGEVRFSDIRRVVDGDRAVNLYSFEVGRASVPMAEAFEIRGDRIARIDLYFDPARLRFAA
jgi:ketosteroid isomerase-like protein